MLVEKNIITSESLHSALAEQEHIKTMAKPKEAAQSNTPQTTAQQSIRVSSDKLDQLIDLVGELVTFNARLGQHAQMANNPTLLMLSEQSERLIIALRNNAMDMRMLPIGTIFTRFRRLVIIR